MSDAAHRDYPRERLTPIPVRRGRDLAEIGVVSGALALMTNLVMAYNAGQLQQSLDAEIASGADLAECIKGLQHVGPVTYGHINFRGTYSFPIDRYATRILRWRREGTNSAAIVPPWNCLSTEMARHDPPHSGSARLDAGALQLAKAGSGHYRPTLEDGKAVNSCYSFRVRFESRN